MTAAEVDQRRAVQAAPVGLRRGRSLPHILMGSVLVLVCALAFAVTGLRVDPKAAVLALAGAIPAGHVLTDADLTVVRVAADASVSTVPESERASVVGRSVRLPLAARSLLSAEALGPAAWPPAGQSVVAVPVKAGRSPFGLVAGVQVLVVVVPAVSNSTGQAAGPVLQARGAVVAVEAPDTTGTTVVSLLMESADAVRVVGAVGDVALVVQG
ncbi:hypothetical protein GCM10009557_00290 [Virgisporangium ochraceum]|uniref:SAF domain-containing protein n=1 Tax=Virgisporangium ochraceum TaxID=65505 RepID=A0A8J4A740_9ACTN|nr:SAF domain-containing protein [Virgisporangium ochraceum]GIJ74061.1 hypothetical protein Voc01_089780 [Virgisporangium ochraceum]